MNTGQMIMVIGALTLFSTATLTVNRVLQDSDRIAIESQSGVMAVALGQSRLEMLQATPFDSIAVGVRIDSMQTPLTTFMCTTRVDFVQPGAPEVTVAGSTPLKRLRVTVANTYMTGSVALQSLVGAY